MIGEVNSKLSSEAEERNGYSSALKTLNLLLIASQLKVSISKIIISLLELMAKLGFDLVVLELIMEFNRQLSKFELMGQLSIIQNNSTMSLQVNWMRPLHS